MDKPRYDGIEQKLVDYDRKVAELKRFVMFKNPEEFKHHLRCIEPAEDALDQAKMALEKGQYLAVQEHLRNIADSLKDCTAFGNYLESERKGN